jgi:Uma2 family endonuclease
MTTVTVMSRDTPWSVDELDGMPDDGLRYELFDGALIVSAAPNIPHERAVFSCARLLHARCPAELEVFVAPVDFQPNQHTSLQPDVLVAQRHLVGVKNLTDPPVLAVEVLSEGSRAKDLVFKRDLYQRYQVTSYWVIDPIAVSFTAYDRCDGVYRQVAQAHGGETVTLELPFNVQVCPADLVVGR